VNKLAIRDLALRARRLLVGELGTCLDHGQAGDPALRQAALTHLVRLVAFKMLQARGHVHSAIERYPDCDGLRQIDALIEWAEFRREGQIRHQREVERQQAHYVAQLEAEAAALELRR